MDKKLGLSIVVSTALTSSVLTFSSTIHAEDAPKKVESQSSKSSGKCASGKCGTEKIYGSAKIEHDPQDKLVYARDGKCGITGQGLRKQEGDESLENPKCVEGVCGA